MPCGLVWGRTSRVHVKVQFNVVVHGRVCFWFYGRVYASVNVVPDANANAVAPVHDLVHVDLTVDEGRSGREPNGIALSG
jgi:hypothetical protein